MQFIKKFFVNKKYCSLSILFSHCSINVSLAFLLSLLLANMSMLLNASATEHAVKDVLEKRIRYSFTIQNMKNKLIKSLVFKSPAPLTDHWYQKCTSFKTSHEYKMDKDLLNNQILKFDFHNIAPYEARVVYIEANIQIGAYISKKMNANYLMQSPLIESNSTEIQNLSKTLKTDNIMKTAKKIFSYVSKRISYSGYIKRDRGALYALKHKKGDCTEFAYLFTALCRASKIPARPIAGYICEDNCLLTPVNYHTWAEFYANNKWYLVDPQQFVFNSRHNNYIAMQILSCDGKTLTDQLRYQVDSSFFFVKMN